MNTRRDFLKMLFGGLAATATGKAIVRDIVPVEPPPITPVEMLDTVSSWICVQEFDLQRASSVLLKTPPGFLLYQVGFQFEQCEYSALRDAFEHLWVEMLIGQNIYFESPLEVMPHQSPYGGHRGGPFAVPLLINDQLRITLNTPTQWKPSAVKGSIILQGIRRWKV
jgi:hypothetical protein